MLEASQPRLPKFLSSFIDENNELKKLAHEGLNKKFLQKETNNKEYNKDKYIDRLNYEISIINKTRKFLIKVMIIN